MIIEVYKQCEKIKDIQGKHKHWMDQYEGLKYGMGSEGHYKAGFQWTTKKYSKDKWSPEINLVGRLLTEGRIEFDGNEEEAKKHLEETEKKLKENGWAYIRSTHNGKCDYLWIEFNRPIKDKELESFLMWIAPEGSEIDLNFASSKKIFPVMFAVHWKHSYFREQPIYFNDGKLIDFDSLNIKQSNKKGKTSVRKDGYETFKAGKVFTRLGQAEQFIKQQPIYYDSSKIWWFWNKQERYWEMCDETDILNKIEQEMDLDVVSSKAKGEILTSLQLIARRNKPKQIKTSWIQFKDCIIDIETDETFEPSSEYFTTNPIPWNLGKSDETPTMDRIFTEWVGKDYVKTLYEILAYSLIPDYPIHRVFCFIGSGLNGKSKYLDLKRKFVGSKNCCSTELDSLMTSRFEVARLHKKLVCLMGETNFGELSKTSMLKKLSGGDLIGFEYKNKNPFEEKNYAKILISTNNLPATTDKTIGFYRRWMIIDFPNSFSEKKDILKDIPDEEYENLAKKSITILKELLQKREFTNEGTIQDRIEKYESKSNFIETFIKQFTKEDIEGHITVADFYKKFTAWSKENRHREMSETSVGMAMKKLGIMQERKYFNWMYDGKGGNARVWTGIEWK